MKKRKCLVRVSYEGLHKALGLGYDVVIDGVFITEADKMSENITIKVIPGPYMVDEGEVLPFVPLEDLQRTD